MSRGRVPVLLRVMIMNSRTNTAPGGPVAAGQAKLGFSTTGAGRATGVKGLVMSVAMMELMLAYFFEVVLVGTNLAASLRSLLMRSIALMRARLSLP